MYALKRYFNTIAWDWERFCFQWKKWVDSMKRGGGGGGGGWRSNKRWDHFITSDLPLGRCYASLKNKSKYTRDKKVMQSKIDWRKGRELVKRDQETNGKQWLRDGKSEMKDRKRKWLVKHEEKKIVKGIIFKNWEKEKRNWKTERKRKRSACASLYVRAI